MRRYLHGAWHASRQLEAVLAQAGPLDLTELVVLEYAVLSDLGPSGIAAALRLPAHTVSRVLGRLEATGLLQRRLDDDDARRRTLVPTRAGRTLLERLHRELHAHVGPLLAVHQPQQLSAFASVLTGVVAAEGSSDDASATVSGSGAAPSDGRRGRRSRRR